MAQKKENKLDHAVLDLEKALKFYKEEDADESSAFLAVAKGFEVATEYAWKELKRRLEEKGIEDIYAPKDVIRKAAQTGLLDDAEQWLNFVDARNESVHDYYSMTPLEYIELAKKFIKNVKKVFA